MPTGIQTGYLSPANDACSARLGIYVSVKKRRLKIQLTLCRTDIDSCISEICFFFLTPSVYTMSFLVPKLAVNEYVELFRLFIRNAL